MVASQEAVCADLGPSSHQSSPNDAKQPRKKCRAKQMQDKANRIVMEAIAKAQAAGNVDIPKVSLQKIIMPYNSSYPCYFRCSMVIIIIIIITDSVIILFFLNRIPSNTTSKTWSALFYPAYMLW